MNWRGLINKYRIIAITGILAIFGAVSVVATAAAINPPVTKTQQYIAQGYRPASCNAAQIGKHQCNLVVPVNKSGAAMRARTFTNAAKTRQDTAAIVPDTTTAPSDVYSPQQLHTAYQLPCTPHGPVQGTCAQPSSFGPNSIAIVDAGGYRGPGTLEGSLAAYDQQYGLPACTQANGCLTIVNQTGQTAPLPPPMPLSDNWDIEYDLDVQTAHMICQSCKVVVVEADDNGDALPEAVPVAASFDPVAISLSWGGNNEPADNVDFQYKGIAVVGSSGDNGSDEVEGYPGDIADVIDASGTTLDLNSNNTRRSETVWSDSGGGCALSGFNAPAWQIGLSNWHTAGCGQTKGDGDMSAIGDPIPGVAVYSDGMWTYGGGTSLSAPVIASAFALAGHIPGNVYGSQYIYQNASRSNIHDITQGNDCTGTILTHCTAAPGFDEPSGLGSFYGLGLFRPSANADFNKDGKVNVADLSIMIAHWNSSTATISQGDFNGDGHVNAADLSKLITYWLH